MQTNKKVLLAIGGTFLVIGIAVFVTIQVSPNLFGLCKSDCVTYESQSETTQAKKEIPADFEELKLDGAKAFYPKDWGKTDKEKTKEDFSGDDMPYKVYDGESVIFDDYIGSLYVMDKKSLDDDRDVKDTVSLLEDLYEKRSVEPEEVYALDSAYIPQPNAGVLFFNPRYIESQNSKWRGYWFLANMSQDVSVNVNMVAVMYNKEAEKVLSIDVIATTKDSDELQDEFLSANNEYGGDRMIFELERYLKSAYIEDKELKEVVDEELLNFCYFLE